MVDLASLPTLLDGYNQRIQRDQAAEQAKIAQATSLAGLMQHLQAQKEKGIAAQREAEMRRRLAAGEDPEKVAVEYAPAGNILSTVTASKDRAAMRDAARINSEAMRAQRIHEIEQQGVREIAAIRERAREQRITKEEADARELVANERNARLIASLRAPPQPQPVTVTEIADPQDPSATLKIDARTGRVIGKGPKLTQFGQMEQKRKFGMEGFASDLQQAEDLLMGQKRDSEGNVTPNALPTGSGIGSVVDSAAALVGITPSGAAEADALKVVAGRLIQKVPRFEGPQSDKDTALYKQMAGDAGNEKLPRARRLMAVRKMRELYSKYESGTGGRLVPSTGASGTWDGTDRRNAEEPPPGAVRRRE